VNKSIRRLDRLEARAGINVELPEAIVVQFVEPSEEFGNRPCRSDRAEADGRTWYPMPSETEVDFEKRVLAELPALAISSRKPGSQFMTTLDARPSRYAWMILSRLGGSQHGWSIGNPRAPLGEKPAHRGV
jgi:hypothetical protein